MKSSSKYLSAMATIYAARKWREDFANGTTARHKIKVGDKEVETITQFGMGPYSDTRLFTDYKKWLKEQENMEPQRLYIFYPKAGKTA